MKIYCNGELIAKEEIKEVFEPGFLFGWGVFEPLRAYKGNIPFLSEHLNRLNRSLDLLNIDKIDLEWEKIIKDLFKKNNLEDAYLRITVYKKRNGAGCLIYADKFGYYNQETYEKGFRAIVSAQKRSVDSISSKVKSISYLDNRISWLGAQQANNDEALVLNSDGFLAGGSRSNLFLVKDKIVFTPSLKDGAFDGITKEVVKGIAKRLDLSIEEKRLKIEDLFNSDEAFITSALMEVMPLIECEDRKIGKGIPGELTLKILSEYRRKL